MTSLVKYISEKLIIDKNTRNKINTSIYSIADCEWRKEPKGPGTGQNDVGQEPYTTTDCKNFYSSLLKPILDNHKPVQWLTAHNRYYLPRFQKPVLIYSSVGRGAIFIVLGYDSNGKTEQYWINSPDYDIDENDSAELNNKNNTIRFVGYFGSNDARIGLSYGMRSYFKDSHSKCYNISESEFLTISNCFKEIEMTAKK